MGRLSRSANDGEENPVCALECTEVVLIPHHLICIIANLQEVNAKFFRIKYDTKSVVLDRQEVGSEVCLFVLQAQFLSDTASVGFNRTPGQVQYACNVGARDK